MTFHKKFLSASVLSVIDQGMLSALNFLIGAVLIRLATKEEYGLYGQLYSGGLLAGLIVDSWIAGPLTTVASAVHASTRKNLLRRYWAKQIFWTVLMGLTAFLIVEFVPAATHHADKALLLGAAFGAYVIGNGLREYGRTVGFIMSDIRSVLRQDIVYVVAVLGGLAWLYHAGEMAVAPIMFMLAGCSVLCALFGRQRLIQLTGGDTAISDEDRVILQNHQTEIQGHGRWAVAGVIVGWLSNYSYIYLSGIWLGLSAIADLNAARLLLMPIPLAVAAWVRVARPEAARLMAAHDWKGLRKLTWFSLAGIEAVVLMYVGFMLLTLPWLERHVIGNKYDGLDPLIMLWGAYFAVNSARTIGTSWLMSGGEFRSMFFLGTVTLLLVIGITTATLPYLAAAGAIVALIAVEIFETVVVWRYILPTMQRSHQNAAAAVSSDS